MLVWCVVFAHCEEENTCAGKYDNLADECEFYRNNAHKTADKVADSTADVTDSHCCGEVFAADGGVCRCVDDVVGEGGEHTACEYACKHSACNNHNFSCSRAENHLSHSIADAADEHNSSCWNVIAKFAPEWREEEVGRLHSGKRHAEHRAVKASFDDEGWGYRMGKAGCCRECGKDNPECHHFFLVHNSAFL